jgi:hypothetical protein
MRGHVPGMNNQHPRRNFTPSDDALIRQQPVTGISLKLLAAVLRTNREALMHLADELGVSLVISNEPDHDQAIDNGFIDPLLERLKRVYGGEII